MRFQIKHKLEHSLSWNSCISFSSLRFTCLCFALLLASALMPVSGQLHFISMGNWGSGNHNQVTTAAALKNLAQTEHITLIVSPGSNFAGGVSSVNDSVWTTAFENIYATPDGLLKIPMFTVLGSQDWSSNYTAQVVKTTEMFDTEHSKDTFPKWTTPNFWYHYVTHFTASTGPAFLGSGHQDIGLCFTFIDTWILSNSFPVSEISKRAWKELVTTLSTQEKICDYIIVVGDRSIYSSGGSNGYLARHLLPLLKKANVDLYISGSDFTMEVTEQSGISFINCGSASKSSSSLFPKQGGSALFFSGDIGFCAHQVTAKEIKTKFIQSATGQTLYEHSQPIKNRPAQSKLYGIAAAKSLPNVEYVPIPHLVRMPGREIFIKVVGSIGLCISFLFVSLGIIIGVSRAAK